MTHLECNPQLLRMTSNQGGLHFHEWKVQMGLPQSDLLALQKSIQAHPISHSRRVLSGLPLQPQIRDSTAQRSGSAKTQYPHFQEPSPDLWNQSDRGSDSDLASRRLSVLSAAQSSPAPMATVGGQALNALSPSAKTTPALTKKTITPISNRKTTPTCAKSSAINAMILKRPLRP